MFVQDHPVIRMMEMTGYPDGKEPEYPICPICGEETDTFYVDADKLIIGCDSCVEMRNAWDFSVVEE